MRMNAGAMQPSTQPSLRGGLDELVIEALASFQQPVARRSDAYFKLEVVWDDEEGPDDVAVTHRFVRFSAPYERVEIEPLSSSLASLRRRGRPTRFVTTVPAPAPAPPPSVTLAFDKVWFDQPEDALATIEEVSGPRASSWLWLGISLLAAAVGVGFIQYAL